jgi:hypothetical protein
MTFFVFIAAFAFAEAAYSFPENMRLGYSSCSSCHVDPTGGGVLNAYGEASASAYLPTWLGREAEDKKAASWGVIGGDIRTVHVKSDSASNNSKTTNLLMQAEAQTALYLSDQITIAGSYGIFSIPAKEFVADVKKKEKYELSNYYLMLKPNPVYALRAGMFVPAYGLRIADHTASIRSGLYFPARAAKLGGEAILFSEYGEASIGSFVTPDGDFVAARLAIYLGKNNQVGASYYGSMTQGYAAGGFGFFGIGSFYAMGELDFQNSVAGKRFVGYAKIADELVKGVHVYTIHDKVWQTDGTRPNRITFGVQIFPVPHYELTFELKNYERPIERTYLLMNHIYF